MSDYKPTVKIMWTVELGVTQTLRKLHSLFSSKFDECQKIRLTLCLVSTPHPLSFSKNKSIPLLDISSYHTHFEGPPYSRASPTQHL